MSAIAPPSVLTPNDVFACQTTGKASNSCMREINVSKEPSRVAGRICTRLDNFAD